MQISSLRKRSLRYLPPGIQKCLPYKQLGLYDAWAEVHNLHSCHKQAVPLGYTFGHSIHGPGDHNDRFSRRLDRIHVLDSPKGHFSAAFTSFLCRSDHKCVAVSCAPLVFHTQHPRFRRPTKFLENEDVAR